MNFIKANGFSTTGVLQQKRYAEKSWSTIHFFRIDLGRFSLSPDYLCKSAGIPCSLEYLCCTIYGIYVNAHD